MTRRPRFPERLNALPLAELYEELGRTGLIRRALELARDEDLGPGERDATGEVVAAGRGDEVVRMVIRARERGVLCGARPLVDLASVFAGIEVAPEFDDGRPFDAGETVARVSGTRSAIVRAERTILNVLGRLSGVATRASAFVGAAGDGAALLYDTRKTTPGLRVLEKYAVRCGGACCHRLGLHDAVLIKDNHLAGLSSDGIAALVARARSAPDVSFVEVEVDTLEQLDAILALPAERPDVVLLDNMSPAELREAVVRRDARAPGVSLEASGGVTLVSGADAAE
ncbi:MAG: carboxylating nicotinate-nucleotide diphosphorylase, partial [Planctomycetota bacterium]